MSADIQKRIVTDEAGCVVLLANVPNAGTIVVAKTAQRTGNVRHDGRSGKFAPGGGGPKKSAAPVASQATPANANVDPAELERMMSAARDAAREFDTFSEGDIKEFLKGRAKDHTVVDLQQFVAMVRRQRVSDIADLLDQQLRSTGSMKQGRRKVRLSAPKGFIRKALKDITPEESSVILHSLVARGHSEDEAKKFLKDKKLGDVQLSDDVAFSDVEHEEEQVIQAATESSES